MDFTHTNTLSVNPELLNQTPLHPELRGQHEPVQGRAGDHNVVWRPMQPVCGPSTSLLEGFRTPFYAPHKYNTLCSEGLASVAGGAWNHAEWAWLTGSRVVQGDHTPLHLAADKDHEGAIKALVAAKADVQAKDKVRGGVLGGRGGRRRRVCMLLLLFGVLILRFWKHPVRKPQTQPLTLNLGPLIPNACNVRA